LQFSLQTASPETFGYTLVNSCRKIKTWRPHGKLKDEGAVLSVGRELSQAGF